MLDGNWTQTGFLTVKFAEDTIAARSRYPVDAVKNFYDLLNKKVASIHSMPSGGQVVLNYQNKKRFKSTTVGDRVIYWSYEDDVVIFRGLYSSAQNPLLV